MIDTSSLDALLASLPLISRRLEVPLTLKTRRPDAISPATASLAQRGYLGCLPLAHHKADEVVLRLRPGVPLAKTTVGVAFALTTEAMTIAPDLTRFIAGRLSQLDVTQRPQLEDEKLRSELIEFSAEWGGATGVESTTRVLAALPTVRKLRQSYDRMAALWASADPTEPLFEVLGKVWTLSGDRLGKWLASAIERFPDDELICKLYVANNVLRKTSVDLTSAAWRVLTSDALFDATYNGSIPGPSLRVWRYMPHVLAAQWLDAQNPRDLDAARSLSLDAGRALANEPKKYSGLEHLEAARALATIAPELAYNHAVTAAAFYVRATGKTPAASIALAHELATARQWPELSRIFRWTMEELGA